MCLVGNNDECLKFVISGLASYLSLFSVYCLWTCSYLSIKPPFISLLSFSNKSDLSSKEIEFFFLEEELFRLKSFASKGRQKISKLWQHCFYSNEIYLSSAKQGYKSFYCQGDMNPNVKLMTHFMLEEKVNKSPL